MWNNMIQYLYVEDKLGVKFELNRRGKQRKFHKLLKGVRQLKCPRKKNRVRVLVPEMGRERERERSRLRKWGGRGSGRACSGDRDEEEVRGVE